MFLGLDLGTSGLKALLVSADGRIVGSVGESYPVAHPHGGWSEQDPADWTAACDRAGRALAAQFPAEMARLKGIGVSGQMHGATLLDADGAVLRPCILWNDVRSHTEAAELDTTPGFRNISGNIVFPGFTAPKLVWVARHEPDVFARVATVLLPKDYLNFWMTGTLAGDMSDGAGTSWLDVGARAWSAELVEMSGMRTDQLPSLHEGCDVMGTLRPDLAATWGATGEVAVVAGAADNAAAACGVGALAEGDGFVSLGTSGVLLAARGSFAPSPATAVHTFCHVVPGRWYQMGVMLAATDSLNWLSRVLGEDPAALSAPLGDTLAAPGAIRFLPYLSGERTPHNDSEIRGAFLHLDISSDRADLTRAVMEGVSFGLRDSYEALKQTGASLTHILGIGGGTHSRYWVELLATVLNLPIDLPEKGEFGGALGAARLAQVGVTGAAPEDVITKPALATTIDPRADLVAAHDDTYRAWREIYPAVKGLT